MRSAALARHLPTTTETEGLSATNGVGHRPSARLARPGGNAKKVLDAVQGFVDAETTRHAVGRRLRAPWGFLVTERSAHVSIRQRPVDPSTPRGAESGKRTWTA
jgi:hypothetical protein